VLILTVYGSCSVKQVNGSFMLGLGRVNFLSRLCQVNTSSWNYPRFAESLSKITKTLSKQRKQGQEEFLVQTSSGPSKFA